MSDDEAPGVSIWEAFLVPVIVISVGAIIGCALTGHWIAALCFVPSAVVSIAVFRFLP